MQAVCIASGPSLTAEDCETVRQWRGDSSDRFVVVTNTTYKAAPWADYLFAMDRKWWITHLDDVLQVFQGARVSCHRNIDSVNNSAIDKPKHSGQGAISLAAKVGATRIVLLGYDCQYKGDIRHWHGDHPKGMGNANTVKSWVGHYSQMNLEGVEVINASRETAITQWPQMELKDALVC